MTIFFTAIFSILLIGCSSTMQLSDERYGHAVVNDGDKIYVLAGSNSSGLLSSIEIIDPKTKKVKILNNKLIPRRFFSAAWDGKHSIYIFGGMSNENKELTFEKRVEIFDTITQKVSFAKPMQSPTKINSTVLVDQKFYILGGSTYHSTKLLPTSSVVVYDIMKNEWEYAKQMPTAKETKAISYNGSIYVVGGYNGRFSLSSFEKFDPQLNQWEILPSLPTIISAHSLAVIDNTLVVFGNYHHLESTYAYNFINKTWNEIDIGYKASRHNSTTTIGNTAYVIGGNTGGSGPYLNYIQTFKF